MSRRIRDRAWDRQVWARIEEENREWSKTRQKKRHNDILELAQKRLPEHEILLRHRLDAQAKAGFAVDGPKLVKKALKALA